MFGEKGVVELLCCRGVCNVVGGEFARRVSDVYVDCGRFSYLGQYGCVRGSGCGCERICGYWCGYVPVRVGRYVCACRGWCG